MARKRLVTVIVVGLVAIGLGSFLVNYLRQSPKVGATADHRLRTERIVAYYFHGKNRSSSCMSIESYAKEAVESGFPEQVKDGRLEWHSVDYEGPGNEHYTTDYQLAAPCVVLVRMRGGNPMEWRSLHDLSHYAGDKPACVRFVQKNVSEFLDYVAIPGACCM